MRGAHAEPAKIQHCMLDSKHPHPGHRAGTRTHGKGTLVKYWLDFFFGGGGALPVRPPRGLRTRIRVHGKPA